MNRFVFLSIFFLSVISLQAADTLRNHDTDVGKIAVFGSPYILMSRFVPNTPVKLKKVILHVDGNPGDTARLRIFGHEGGAQYPQRDPQLNFYDEYLADLIAPIEFELSETGEQQVRISIPDIPSFDNNQFFVAIDQISGMKLFMSTQSKNPYCTASASQGGAMQWQLKADGTNISGSDNPFWLDCIVEYETVANFLFENIIDSSAVPSNTNSAAMSAADLDGDGHSDLLFRNAIYRNTGDGKFSNMNSQIGYRGTAAANVVIDMDNNGLLDILSLDISDSSFLYLQMDSGWVGRQYLAGVPALRSLLSFSISDVNNDSYPDVFLSQLWGAYPEPYPNFLLINDGQNGFRDESTKIYPGHNGLENYPSKTKCAAANQSTWLSNGNRNRRSRGSVFFDYDNDGDQDLYVSNYFLEPDEFYENDGNGNFSDMSSLLGLDRNPGSGSNHGTGVDAGDINNDGFMDLITPQFAHPGWTGLYGHRGTNVYLNTGAPSFLFDDRYGQLGIDWEETHAGAALADVNNDTKLDFVIKTFYGCRFADLYLQDQSGNFENVSYRYGLKDNIGGNDALWVDLDSDGLIDLVTGDNGSLAMFKNKGSYSGSVLGLKVMRDQRNLFALGAKVEVHAGSSVIYREIMAGRGQKMQDPYAMNIGLGNETNIDSVVVKFSDKRISFTNLEINNFYLLEEATGLATKLHELESGGPGVGIVQTVSTAPKVYPNPFKDWIHVEHEESRGRMFMLDSKGSLVLSFDELSDLKTQDLKAGIYFLRIYSENRSYGFKLIKE